MPTKPGSCGLPYYGIEFAVLDPVVSVIGVLITAPDIMPMRYNAATSGNHWIMIPSNRFKYP